MEKLRNSGKWTEGRFRGFITNSLRYAMRRWPPKYEVIKDAIAGVKRNPKTKRMATWYHCALCSKLQLRKNVQVDHITPIGKCDTWDEFIERLFCEKDNLQVVCIPCHKKKTNKDNGNHENRKKPGRKPRGNSSLKDGTSSISD